MTPQPTSPVELLCRSAFSFQEGASLPEELIDRAAELKLSHLGITDRDGVYGLPRAHRRVQERIREGLFSPRLICGSLVSIDDGPGMALLVRNMEGWSQLCQILTRSRCRGALTGAESPHERSKIRKGWGSLSLQDVLERAEGLEAILIGSWSDVHARAVREAFGEHASVALCQYQDGRDALRRASAHDRALESRLPLVASADVLMHDTGRKALQDVLSCLRLKLQIDEAGQLLEPNAARHLLSSAQLKDRFPADPEALERSIEIAERCHFGLEELAYLYPRELVPDAHTPSSWLRQLTLRGLTQRYPCGTPPRVKALIEHELQLIEKLNFPAYFLTVADTVRFARSRGILCQGRGSAANSAVCYALGITTVDPSTSSLLFERFISEERGEPPDIDVDFEHERREEVIQYIYQKYGRHRAAMVNEVISYRRRSGLRDVGKVMGLSKDQVDRLARSTHHFDPEISTEAGLREIGLDPRDPRLQTTLRLSDQIQGLPRHVGVHVGGFTISDTELSSLCPIEPATMAGRTVIQWDKDDIGIVGFVKVDLLSLGILSAIRKSMDLIRIHWDRSLTLASIPPGDDDVYEMLCRADSVGVFQVESRAQMSMLPRLQPRCWYDLVIQVSIVRPGPIQGGMVHPFLARRRGQAPVTYAHPSLRPILERTAGVPIFQEQVMAMAVAVGGFSPGQADQLRRAMGAWRKRGGLEPLTRQLREGLRENGISVEYAEQICAQIEGFGEYGFPESHAASFARLVYVSAWLKCHYPAAFTASLLNSQPMGFYSARSLIADARRHDIEIRPICVQSSQWDSTLERAGGSSHAIRLGLRQIKGLRREHAESIASERAHAPFDDLADLARRTAIPREGLSLLARSGALSSVESHRRQALWSVAGLMDLPLFRGLLTESEPAELPVASPQEELAEDFEITGLSVQHDPMRMLRPMLSDRGVSTASQILSKENGELVRAAGIISHRQRPGTASGIVFMTLEDETGMLNLVVKPRLLKRQRQLILGRNMLQLTARVQRDGLSLSLLCLSFLPIREVDLIRTRSRDFR
jgi:error-prone DNA polymerase